jgi:hypothetical protein
MNSNTTRKSSHRWRFALAAVLALALASGTASAAGAGHGGGFGGGHFGGPGVGHFSGAPGHGHFGSPQGFHGFDHFGHRGFVVGGPIIVPYPYAPYGYYGPGYLYSPYCDPNTPYYDPQYC